MKPRKVVPLALALALGVTAALVTPADATPPSTYNAITTTTVIAKPSVTDSGLFDLNLTDCPTHTAGYSFTPTDFYCPILRVTDPNTDPNHVGFSYLGPASWMQQGWNCTSSFFYIRSSGGTDYVYSFVPSTMTATKLTGTYNGLTSWDSNHTTKCYGVTGTQLVEWDFSTIPATSSTIVDVASLITGITEVYESHPSNGMGDGGTTPVKLIAVTGGTGVQGTDFEVLWYNTSTNTGYIYNTLTATITDTSGHVITSGLPAEYYIHQGSITRDGRYVWIQMQGNPVNGNTGVGPFIWDTTANTVTDLGSLGLLSRPGGHTGLGWAEAINSDYVSAKPTAKWWYRQVDTLTHMENPVSLVANVPSTQDSYDDHQCWNNSQNGSTSANWFPVFLGTIQASGTYNQSPNYWGDEIIGIATADRSGAGANTVWRFAHHRSTITAHPSQDDYNANAWPNVSQDGKWVLFQSNWEETLGTRTGTSYFRTDAFIVKLTQSAH